MPITNCYWLNTVSELLAVHGDDLLGDGSGVSLLPDDIVFIYGPDLELYMYCCLDYSVSVISDHPYEFTGPERAGYGYPRLVILNLDYTTTGIELFEDVGAACADDDMTEDTCELLDDLAQNHPTPLFHQSESVVVDPVVFEEETIDTTEADWDEESGANLSWKDTGVEYDSSDGGGIPLHDIGVNTVPGSPYMGTYVVPGIRGSSNHFMTVYATHPTRIFEVNETTGVVTQKSTVTASWEVLGYACTALRPVYLDQVAAGDYYYTGSKSDQGQIHLFSVDSSYNVTLNQTIATPTPTRNGYFGKTIGMAIVDDSTHGEDTHIITNWRYGY